MTLYQTTDEQKVRLYEIATKMTQAGLAAAFVTKAVELASVSEGVYELVALWEEFAQAPDAREQVLADLQEALDEHEEQPGRVVEKAKLPYDELASVGQRVLAFKAELRRKVDQWGGITKLAEATGMPQPSLSRFFNAASMPRRITLYKIAKAMDLSERDIAFDWVV